MINAVTPLVNRSEGIENSIEHHIKSENLGLIFGILRNQLYSDKILATIRETVQNALDAHVDVGTPTLPVKVTLPTQLNSFFKCRDFGKGLSDEDIEKLYSGYGDSGKRSSNEFIGGWGIGKFASLCYTDSFIINSYQNGVVSSWTNYVDNTQRGKISKMGHALTSEPNGVEIIVPVKNQDINTFHQKAARLFAYFDIVPEMINVSEEAKNTITEIRSMVPVLEGQGYKFFGQRNSKVLMGGMSYNLSSSVFEEELDEVAKTIINEGVVLYFKVGDLQVTASREGLNFDSVTKKKLAAALNNIAKDFLDKGNQAFVNCKTLWEAKCLYEKTMKHDGGLYRFRRFLQGGVTWNGQKISDTHFLKTNQTNGAKCNVYTANSFGRKTSERIACTQNQIIEAYPRYTVVENDLNLEKGITNRIIGLLKVPLNISVLGTAAPYDRVYLVTFKDAATKAAWLKDSEFDGPMTLLSSYPKQKLLDYYESNSTGVTKNAKHTPREFTLNTNYKQSSISSGRWGRRSGRGTNIEYFDSCDVDVDNDAGVYILIDAFVCESMNGGYHVSPQTLIESLCRVKEVCGVAIPTIYAFKKKHEDKVKANKNMVSVWKWMQNHVAAYFTDVKEQTKIANWMAIQAARNECPGLNYFDKLKNFQADPKSDIAPFLTYVRVLFKQDGQLSSEIENKKNLAEGYGIKVRDFKATVDIKTEYKKVQTKYPLLFALVSHIGFDSNEVRQLIKHLESYVAMVDEKTAVVLPVTASNGAV